MQNDFITKIDREEYEDRHGWLAYLAAMKREKFRLQSGLCFYCLQSFDKSRGATMEHLVRQCDGGDTSDENIVMACYECNYGRGATSVEEWKLARRTQP